MRRTNRSMASLLAIVGSTLVAMPAHALLISTNYGGLFSSNQAYRDLANAAKGTWESLAEGWDRVSSHEVTVNIDTADLGSSGILALTFDNHQTANPDAATGTYLWTGARIVFNSNAALWNQFWWDPTPLDNGEYDMSQNGGLYGTGKAGTAADGKFDAYSTVLHELGHVFGFMGQGGSLPFSGGSYDWSAYTSFEDNFTAKYTTWSFDYLQALKGSAVPMGGNPYHVAAGTYPYDSMRASLTSTGDWISGPGLDERILISSLDLNMIVDAFHLIPEPGSLLLASAGLFGFAVTYRGRDRARSSSSGSATTARPQQT